MPPSRLRFCTLALSAPMVAGCSGGCRRGAPYVPFLHDAAIVVAQDADVAAVDAGGDGGRPTLFQPVRASLAPPGVARWSLEGAELEAPTGSGIVAAIARDVDGDGQRDVVAYVQPLAGGGGEIRFYRGDGRGGLLPARTVGGPGDVAIPAPCVGKPLMSLVGAHTVLLDVRPSCGDASPTPRRIVLAAFVPTPSIRWSARLPDPPRGWTLAVDVEAIDRDGDGVDDPTVSFGLEGGGLPFEPGDRIAARVRYWDRPTGLSRDRTEPEASFQSIAAQAAGRSSKRTTAVIVPGLVGRLRLLYGAICAEGGAPWVDVAGEHGIPCGASRALEEAGAAEARAALTMGDLLVAIAARERLAAPASARISRVRADVDKAILAAAPSIWATTKELRPLPSTLSKGAPAWGAIAFEKAGTVLIRTVGGVARVDPVTFDEGEATDVASWSWEVAYPGKDAKLGVVVDTCESPYLGARVAGHDVPTGAILLPIPILPTLSRSRCAEGKLPSHPTTPVGWTPSGLYALVDHEPVVFPWQLTTPDGARASGSAPPLGSSIDAPYAFGAPRSPNGALLVVPTRFGVVRRDVTTSGSAGKGGGSVLVRARELEGLYGTLRECAVSNDGGRVVCVREGRAILFEASAGAGAGGEVDASRDGKDGTSL